jgi:lipopolysaccharide/colanic/teichoic acid biosynthesis glycosyltransferase
MLKRHTIDRNLLLVLGDCVAVLLAVVVAGELRFGAWEWGGRAMRAAPILLTVFIAAFYTADLYNLRALGRRYDRASYVSCYILGTAMAVIGLALVWYLWPQARMGRGMFIGGTVSMATLGFGWRMLFRRAFILDRRKPIVAVVGMKDEVRVVERELGVDDFAILGFDGGQESPRGNGHGNGNGNGNGSGGAHNGHGHGNGHGNGHGGHGVAGHGAADRAALMDLVQKREVDAVVVGSVKAGRAVLLKSLISAKLYGIEVHTLASIIERVRWKVPITGLTDDWMALTPFDGMSRGLRAAHFMRVVDVVLASVGVLLSSPIVALAALAIKCESRGPVFYRQTRVGLDGREFRIIKLRSMRCDAEVSGPRWAKDRDPRVTKVGRLLRKYRIDELPQMWNVLVGDMRVIGPRPERPEFVRMLEGEIPFYAVRHAVRPGITGWAQVSFRYGASSDDAREKLEYDLFYIKNQSVFLDLVIVLKTFRVVFFGGTGGKDAAPHARREWTEPTRASSRLTWPYAARDAWVPAEKQHETHTT